MSSRRVHATRRLHLGHLLLVVAFIGLGVGAETRLHATVTALDADTRAIATAGRLEIEALRVARAATDLAGAMEERRAVDASQARETLDRSLAGFQAAHEALARRGTDGPLTGTNPPAVLQALGELDLDRHRAVQAALELARIDPEATGAGVPDGAATGLSREVGRGVTAMLPVLHRIGAAAQAAADGHVAVMRQVNLVLVASTLGLLVLHAAFVMLPASRMIRRERSASSAKSDFLAHVSHEIRTPMTAIVGYSELLEQDDDFRNDPERMREAIETIRANGRHMLAIVNDVLDISKIEAGRLTIESLEVDPAIIVEESLAIMRPKAAASGLSLIIEYATPIPPRITSDPTRLRQILVNLVGNAVKFTRTGTVTVRVSADATANSMRFDVIDTGVGMSPEQIERIRDFRAFAQADESTAREYGGTGLGLRISHSLAGLLGGALTFESEEGQGSTFTATIAMGEQDPRTFVWPRDAVSSLAADRQAARDQEAPPAPKTGNEATRPLFGLRVLFAEDGPDNQRLIRFHLEKAGAEVVVVDNGREAVREATEAHESDDVRDFDLILMDMQMPVLDGYGATRALRAAGYTLPIVALTAHALDGARARCLGAGCDGYLSKPVDRVELIDAVRTWAMRKRADAA